VAGLPNKEPARNVCNVKHFGAKGNTLCIGHFLLSGIFVLKAASFLNAGCFHASVACNLDACNQRSTSILG
jgi:hypothetical protein